MVVEEREAEEDVEPAMRVLDMNLLRGGGM